MRNITLAQEQQKQQKNPHPICSLAHCGPAAPKTSCQKLFSKHCAMILSTSPWSQGHTETFWQAKMNQRYFGRSPWHGEPRGRAAEGAQNRGRREESWKRDILSFTLLCKYTWGQHHRTQPENYELSRSKPPSWVPPLRTNFYQLQNLREDHTRLD